MVTSNFSEWLERLRTAGHRLLDRARFWPPRPALAAPPEATSSGNDLLTSLTTFFHPSQRRQLTQLRENLVSSQTQIEVLGSQLEQRFLTIGSHLDQLSEASDRLLASSECLAKLAIGEHENRAVLATATQALQTALHQVQTQEEASQEFALTLTTHLEEITKARSHEVTLRSCLAPLRPIQTLFRVSAAALEADAQGTYASLAQEIDQLNQQVTALLSKQFQSLADYRTRIGQLVQRLHDTHQSQQHALAADAEHLTGSLNSMHTALLQSQGRDLRLSAAARACHEQVGHLVMAMQFQDITRQKLQHVETAFRRLAESLSDVSLDDATAADLHATAAVQLAQLETVEHELREAETKMLHAVTRLLERVEELTNEGVQLRQAPTLIATDLGVVAELLTGFGGLRRLVTNDAAMRAEAHQALDPLAGLASNLTGSMRDVSLRIKFIALNAQIQAVQIGNGTGLEVLSQHTCNISDEVARLSERAAVELDALITSFAALLASCRELNQQALEQQAWLDSEGTGLESQLARFRSAGEVQLGAVANLGNELRAQLAGARADLSFYEAAAPSFDLLRAPLTELAALTAHARHARRPVRGLTEELQGHYTMASEHATSATALGTPATATAITTAQPVPTASTVELF